MMGPEPVSTPRFVHNVSASRYEIHLDGTRVGLADYFLVDAGVSKVVVMSHTETAQEYGGRGLAGQLVRFALDDIEASSRRVRPECSFVSAFILRHPEYAHLVE